MDAQLEQMRADQFNLKRATHLGIKSKYTASIREETVNINETKRYCSDITHNDLIMFHILLMFSFYYFPCFVAYFALLTVLLLLLFFMFRNLVRLVMTSTKESESKRLISHDGFGLLSTRLNKKALTT